MNKRAQALVLNDQSTWYQMSRRMHMKRAKETPKYMAETNSINWKQLVQASAQGERASMFARIRSSWLSYGLLVLLLLALSPLHQIVSKSLVLKYAVRQPMRMQSTRLVEQLRTENDEDDDPVEY